MTEEEMNIFEDNPREPPVNEEILHDDPMMPSFGEEEEEAEDTKFSEEVPVAVEEAEDTKFSEEVPVAVEDDPWTSINNEINISLPPPISTIPFSRKIEPTAAKVT